MIAFNENRYDIFPSKREWKKQGFRFLEAKNEEDVTVLELPKGWKSKSNNNCLDFYDENNTKRGVLTISIDNNISLKLCI